MPADDGFLDIAFPALRQAVSFCIHPFDFDKPFDDPLDDARRLFRGLRRNVRLFLFDGLGRRRAQGLG